MDIASLMTSFATGTYTVTRRARGSVVRGRVQDGSSTTVSITASVSPSRGLDLMKVPEGRRTNGAMTIFTTTFLYVGGVGESYESDRISIGGATWEVAHVETWTDPLSRSVGYKCVAGSTT